VGDRMTEKGRGGGDLVETFELHEITSLPYLCAPRSSERTGTYSACILGVLLRCQRHDELVFWTKLERWLTGGYSIFLYLGNCCYFNIIFNINVGLLYCGRNLHRQPLSFGASRQDASDERIRFLYICIFHGATKFWKTLCSLAEFIKLGDWGTDT
jgi:hypothetical protein